MKRTTVPQRNNSYSHFRNPLESKAVDTMSIYSSLKKFTCRRGRLNVLEANYIFSRNLSGCTTSTGVGTRNIIQPPSCLNSFRESAWDILDNAVSTRGSSTRYVNFATIDSYTNTPEARIVALQHVNRNIDRIDFYADMTSPKVHQIQKNKEGAITLWDPLFFIQARLSVKVDILNLGDDNCDKDVVKEAWDALPSRIQLCYGSTPHPGAQIDHPSNFMKKANMMNFCIFACNVHKMDLVYLDPEDRMRDRRALYLKNENWNGKWLSP